MKNKFVKSALIIAVVMIVSVVALTACSSGETKNGKTSVNPLDVYCFSAVTGGSLLQTTTAGHEASAQADSLTADEIEKVNSYVKTFDAYVTSGGFTSEVVPSDREEYAVKVKITATGLGGVEEKILYYNEIDTKSGEVVDEDETERFSETTLSGILVDGENTYFVEGYRKQEVEIEGDETEVENEIFIKTYLTESEKDKNFVTVKYCIEKESNEVESAYEYCRYSEGNLIEKTKISVEKENEADKSEEEIEIKSLVGGVANVYKLEREIKNGKTELKLSYTDGNKINTIEVEVVDGKYVYSVGNEKYEFD